MPFAFSHIFTVFLTILAPFAQGAVINILIALLSANLCNSRIVPFVLHINKQASYHIIVAVYDEESGVDKLFFKGFVV